MWNKIIDISAKAVKQWKAILLIYIVQLALGIIVAITAFRQFDGAIGNSLELDRLAKGFDRSIFSDMINKFPSMIGKIQNRFGLVVLLFMILSIFLHAGLLGNIRTGHLSIAKYFQNAKKYFFKFLGIALISILKITIVLSIIWVPFVKWMDNPLESFHSEKTLILTVIGLLILSALLIIVIWLWSVLSRYQMVDGDRFVLGVKNAWKILRSNFARYYLVGLLLIGIHILITWLYTLLVDDWGAEIWLSIIGLITIQQIFSIIRIWVRVFGFIAVDNT